MTTEEKALALVNEVQVERNWPISNRLHRGVYSFDEALCRAIERERAAIEAHEADKKAFSDAVKKAIEDGVNEVACDVLSPFIQPEPEPDPLVEAVNEAWGWRNPHPDVTENLRQALAARGWKMNLERIEQ